MKILILVLLILGGLVLLKYGADYLLSGAVGVARRFGLSELVIGLTIVAVGTSAPELVTAIAAALRGDSGIVLGNAIGSNVANLTLILGAGALLSRIPTDREMILVQKPVLAGITVLCALLLLDGQLSRLDGALLMIVIVVFTVWLLRRGGGDAPVETAMQEAGQQPLWQQLGLLALGLGGLVLGAAWLVRGASGIAEMLGVGSTAIGATVVGLGTSAPELAATFAAVRRKRYAILLGNLVGSCQFNLAAILGIPALITPIVADRSIMLLHLPAVGLATALAWLLMYTDNMTLRRREGAVFVFLYIIYIVLCFSFK